MASVRVRKRSYSTISGDAPSTLRRPLSSIFRSGPDSGAEHGTSGFSATVGPRRPRARSRIEDSLLARPTRPDQTEKSSRSGSPSTRTGLSVNEQHNPETVTIHGQDINLELPGSSAAGQGLVDNAILRSETSLKEEDPFTGAEDYENHEDNIVEHLDVIDPQVYTVANLANAANSILIPPISLYSRKPLVALPLSSGEQDPEKASRYEDHLDRHVDEVLNGRRAKLRRALQGLWSFLKTPMGVIVAIYGFCVVFWGAAIVFFLAKIINLHNDNTQGFWVEVSSQVVNGLFTVTGIGFIPYRILDSYRIFRIWHYKLLTRKLRRKVGLPPLIDEDDLPDPFYDPNYVHVLTEKQEHQLHRQQRKFRYSQSWYRPHGTPTHKAFPIKYAIIICLLNDLNSIFQIILCATMWSLNRFQRPPWSTGILIPAGFLSGIGSAVVIWKGGQRTRRNDEVEARLRAALTEEPARNLKKTTGIRMEPPVIVVDPGNTEATGGPSSEAPSIISTTPTSTNDARDSD